MTRILCLGDLHLSDRPPSACTESYQDDLFELIRCSAQVARQSEVDAVVWAGEMRHLW